MIFGEIEGKQGKVKVWTPLEGIELQAQEQLRKIASLPWIYHHVAAMPDVHFGIGATIGSVIAMKSAITPAAVGVDIGCGMGACLTDLKASDLPDSLKDVRLALEELIPTGFNAHEKPVFDKYSDAGRLMDEFSTLPEIVQDQTQKAACQLGTLGGGNHFLELCLDTGWCPNCENNSGYTRHLGENNNEVVEDCKDHQTEPRVWMMLHSGSRGIGNKLATYHMSIAKTLLHNKDLPDPNLAVFLASTPEFNAYRRDLFWAQRYAMVNRQLMMARYHAGLEAALDKRKITLKEQVWCHHNYVAEETHFGEQVLVTRKGAIRAGKGDMGIIPGSMGAKSFIVRGLGNPESFESASHGAGRKMSRTQARKKYTVEDLETMTKGVECRKDKGVLDEIPAAYKDIDEVMKNQSDLVEVVATLKQVMCMKGET